MRFRTRRLETISFHDVQLLHDGKEAFPAMLSAIDAAKEEVLLEMYWFADDRIGQRFSDALVAAAARGVRVVVIYDAFGSHQSASAFWASLRLGGVEVLAFGPINPLVAFLEIERVNRRNHRKVLVVDGDYAVIGGLNIGDEWAPPEDGGQGWRDDAVALRGAGVVQIRQMVARSYHLLTSTRLPKRLTTIPSGARAPSTHHGRLLYHQGIFSHRSIRRAYLTRIQRAKHAIVIINSYFVPDRKIRKSLEDAARRGVNVRVMLPGKNDVYAVALASAHLYSKLLRAGVQIYEWQGSVLHAKSAIFDDEVTSIGTYNLDYRSWLYNLEVAIEVVCKDVAAARLLRFEEDLESATEVRLVDWNQRSFTRRFLEWLAFRFRKFL